MIHRLIVTAVPGSPGVFVGHLEEGGGLVIRSSQPLVAGARELLARGYGPAALLTLRHAGKGYDSFAPLPIGQWAGWTYEERDRDGIRCARWMPRQLHGEGQKSGSGPVAGVRVPDAGRIAPGVHQAGDVP